jgi:hypothetical protein
MVKYIPLPNMYGYHNTSSEHAPRQYVTLT